MDFSGGNPEPHAVCFRAKDGCEAVRAKDPNGSIWACTAHPSASCFTFTQDGKSEYRCFETSSTCGALQETQKSLLEGDSYSGHTFEISGCGDWK